jgi:hypothetical protein
VRAKIGVVGVDITNTGQGWAIGDRIELPGNYDTSPAILEISGVGTLGYI